LTNFGQIAIHVAEFNHNERKRQKGGHVRDVTVFISAFAVCLVIAGESAIASPTEQSDRRFQQEISQRLENLAKLVNEEASRGSAMARTLSKSRASQVLSIVKDAQASGSGIAALVRPLTNNLSAKATTNVEKGFAQAATLQSVEEKSRALADYANYLSRLRDRVSTAKPEEIIPILEAAYVPPAVQIVIDPSGPGGPNPPGTQPFTVPTSQSSPRGGGIFPFIVGGGTTVDYPAAGAILYDDGGGHLYTGCTGTLIAVDAVLTAAHCKEEAEPQKVYFQHGGIYDIKPPIQVNPRYSFPFADLAIIFLTQPVVGISPIPINDITDVAPNSSGQIIGFGYHSGSLQLASTDPTPMPEGGGAGASSALVTKPGMKLRANITSNSCPTDQSGQSLICWTYVQGPLQSLNGSTCFGDSGGPFIKNIGGQWRLAGVTAGGKTCAPGDRAVDVDVYAFSTWIKQQLASTTTSTIPPVTGNLPQLNAISNNQARYIVAESDLIFGPGAAPFQKPFTIGESVQRLRVGVNATPTAQTLRLEVGPTGSVPSCVQEQATAALYCDLINPQAGGWSLKVTGTMTQEFQVVATVF
jgi:hypothetical protein